MILQSLNETKVRNNQLMSLAQKGDMAAFDALIAENEPHFKGVAHRESTQKRLSTGIFYSQGDISVESV